MKLRIAKKVICFRGSFNRRAITFSRARLRWLRWMDRLINRVIKDKPHLSTFKDSFDKLRPRR